MVRKEDGVVASELFRFLFSEESEEHMRKDPVAVAAHVFTTLVNLQAFHDGNKRASNLMMNYVLMKGGYSPFILHEDNMVEYARLVYRFKRKSRRQRERTRVHADF